MATTLTSLVSSVTFGMNFTAQKSVNGVTGSFVNAISKVISLAFGNAANQADMVYYTKSASIAVAPGALTLDLAGPLKTAFGDDITFSKVKAVLVINESTTATTVDIGGVVNQVPIFKTPLTDKVPVPSGGAFMLAAAIVGGLATVTAGTGDLLTITNTDGANVATVTVVVIGTSA